MLDLAVTADNAKFASVGGDKQVFLWDVETGTTVRRWSGHDARVEAVEFGAEADSIVASGMNYFIYYTLHFHRGLCCLLGVLLYATKAAVCAVLVREGLEISINHCAKQGQALLLTLT